MPGGFGRRAPSPAKGGDADVAATLGRLGPVRRCRGGARSSGVPPEPTICSAYEREALPATKEDPVAWEEAIGSEVERARLLASV